MRARDYALLVALAAVWGLSFVFYRVAVPSLGAGLFADLRVGLAALALLVYLAASGRFSDTWARLRSMARPLAVVGALNAAVPFALIGFSELTLPASYASVLNATMPLFSAALAAEFLAQPIRVRHAIGLAAGVVGVGIVVGAAPFPLTPSIALAVAASVAAAASYALAAIYIRVRLPRAASLDLNVGQQLTATAWLLPLALLDLPSARYPAEAIGSVVAIALICTVLAYLAYFHLLQRVGPTHASTVTFLMPVFGVVWGNLLLAEPVHASLLVGFAAVLLGVALVTGVGRSREPGRPE